MGFLDTWFLSGDFVGGIIAVYTSRMGQLFYGFIVLGIMYPQYYRGGDILYPLIVFSVIGGAINYMFPTPILTVTKVIFAITIAVLLYRFYMGVQG